MPRKRQDNEKLLASPLQPLEIDRLAPLFRLKPQEVSHYAELLSLKDITLALSEHGKGYVILFQNSKTGQLVQIEAGLFAQSLKPLAGFTVRGQSEDPDTFLKRVENAGKELAEMADSPEAALPAFTLAYLETITTWIGNEVTRTAFGMSDREWHEFEVALKEEGLHPKLVVEQDNLVLTFVGFNDVYQPLNGRSDSIGGFAFSVTEEGSLKEPSDDVLEVLNTKYLAVAGLPEHIATELQVTLPRLIPPPPLEWFQEFIQQTHQKKKKKNGNHHPEVGISEEKEKLKQRTIEVLNPHLAEYGLQLIDARQLMQPGYSEAMAQKLYKNRLPFPVADLLIVEKDDAIPKLGYVNLLGWEKPPNPDDERPHELIPYSNVCAIVVVDSNDSIAQRKELTRYGSTQIRRYFPASRPKPTVFTVDEALLSRGWKSLVTPLVEDIEELAKAGSENNPAWKILNSSKKAVDHGAYHGFDILTTKEPRVEIIKYEPGGPRIGGTQLSVVVRRDEKLINVTRLDSGFPYNTRPSWSTLGGFPTPDLGLPPWIESGMYPRLRRLYRLDLLKNSVSESSLQAFTQLLDKPTDTNQNYSDAEFYLMELYHRLGESGFVAFLRDNLQRETQDLMRQGKFLKLLEFAKAREKSLYAVKVLYDLMALTHDHQDHTLGIALMREDIPLGLSADTRALALRDFHRASNWLAEDVAVIRRRDLPKIGSSYQVTERPFLLFEDGQRYEISPGVFVTGYDVYHSIVGSLGFVVDVVHNGKHLVQYGYPGDYRDGRFFERFGKHKLTREEIEGTRYKKKRS